MVNRDLLAAKLAELAERVRRVRSRLPDSAEQLRSDRDALDIVSFNLMLCVQTTADIASHLIADEGWSSARTLADGFARLVEQGVVSAEVGEALKRAVGLRNVVAHGYSNLDVGLCYQAATAGLADLERFAQQVSAWALKP
jgi:uncharacterized protein YutE (UPF0331/DUF86 family)